MFFSGSSVAKKHNFFTISLNQVSNEYNWKVCEQVSFMLCEYPCVYISNKIIEGNIANVELYTTVWNMKSCKKYFY